MKRSLSLFCSLLLVLTVMCSAFCINVSAEGDMRSVRVDTFLFDEVRFIENEQIDICFTHNFTGENYNFTLESDATNFNIELPKGEYTLTNVSLTSNPVITFEPAETELIVDDSEYFFFVLSLRNVILTDENAETVNNAITEFKQQKENEEHRAKEQLVIAVFLILWLILGVIALVQTLKGSRSKNELKRPYFKAKGRFTRHIFFGLIASFFLGYIFGDGEFSWIFALVGFGFPAGITAAGIIFGRCVQRDDDYYYYQDRESSSGGAIFVIIMLFCIVVGAVLVPAILIYDIVQIIKTYINYRKARKQNKNSVNSFR